MTKTSKPLPKTQAAAIEILNGEMSRDAWAAAGANMNAIDALIRKGLVVEAGTVTQFAQGSSYQAVTYRAA